MKTKTTLALLYQLVQWLIIGAIGLFYYDLLRVDLIAFFVIGTFVLSINVITIWIIIGDLLK